MEVHSAVVKAEPERILRAIKELTPAEVPLFRALFVVRSLPALVSRRGTARFSRAGPIWEQALRSGFVLLAEDPNREVVLGIIGQFWKPRGGSSVTVADAHGFVAFDRPGYAKAAINFLLKPGVRGLRLTTETRVLATDPEARRKFGLYWAIISVGSGFVRRMWLRAIKRRAEGRAPAR